MNTQMELPPPPDGGYGWIIVAASFIINILSFGILSSIGIIFDPLIKEFGCSRSEVSAVASIAFALQSICAPFASLLINFRISSRIAITIGTAMVAGGFIVSSFAPQIYFLYFSFGVLSGSGLAFIYLPHLVLLSFYFNRHRTMAAALASVGAYVGSFVAPYLYRTLIENYGWRGALLIIGGLQLNSLPFALLLRPLEKRTTKASACIEERSDRKSESVEQLQSFIEQNITGCTRLETVSELPQEQDADVKEVDTNKKKVAKPAVPYLRSVSLMNDTVATSQPNRIMHKDLVLRQFSDQPSSTEKSKAPKDTLSPKRARAESSGSKLSSFCNLYTAEAFLSTPSLPGGLNGSAPFTGGPVDFARTLSRNSSYVEQQVGNNVYNNVTPRDNRAASDDLFSVKKSDLGIESVEPSTPIKRRYPYLDYFRNWKYTIFVIVSFLKGLAFYCPNIFIVDWGYNIGCSDYETTVLLSLIGVGNIVGRPIVALFSDLFVKHRTYLLILLFVLIGLITISSYFFPTFYYLAAFTFMYSFLLGGITTLVTPYLADIFPLSQLAVAFGMLSFIEGFSLMAGPPLLALLPDVSAIFLTSGVILFSLSLLLVVSALVEHFKGHELK